MTDQPAFYRFLSAHRVGINAAVVALLQCVTAPITLIFAATYSWWILLVSFFASSALYFRHRYPYPVLAVIFASFAISLALPAPMLGIWWVVPLAVYHIGRYGHHLLRKIALAGSPVFAVLAGTSLLTLIIGGYGWSQTEKILVGLVFTLLCLAIYCAAWFIGDSRRLRVIQRQELAERAARLEYESEQERKLAAGDERTRIAREMHDIVAHSLSVIIAQADGARYAVGAQTELDGAVQLGIQTLGTISDTARE